MEQQTTPVYAAQPVPQEEKVTGIGNWIGTMFLLCIPIVGMILSIVWAVSAESASKRNYFRAYWIMLGIATVLIILIAVIAAAAGATLLNLSNMF